MSDIVDRVERTDTYVVDAGQAPERIDRWLTAHVQRATRTKVQDAIDAGAVLVNGATTKSNYRVRPGDVITVTTMKQPPIELVAQDIPLDIVFEDDQFLIVNKRAGMVTHPGYGNRDGTLVNAVLFHVGGSLPTSVEAIRLEKEDEGEEEVDIVDDDDDADDEVITEDAIAPIRPGIVHRLDKDTSGLMVVAKNADAQVFLAKQFADRTATREYWAVVWGSMNDDEGEIERNIARDKRDRRKFAASEREGKWALTKWKVIERFEFATLVSLRLATGRTHQIRVHCAHIGHPIFGDPTYGGRGVVYQSEGGKHKQRVANLLKTIDRQALHAKNLGVWHPVTNELMDFTSELPADIQTLVKSLRG
ncbi:MAG: RluA family pseudouridine synthase [bacterium]|nr:RluA family pseudouridine synthase [Candidatus Kapabacteria bacterium]